jgi:hypothetical protein
MSDLFESPKVGDTVFVVLSRSGELEPNEITKVNGKSFDVKFRGRYRRDNGKEVGGDHWFPRSVRPDTDEYRSRYTLQELRKSQRREWESMLTTLQVRVLDPDQIEALLPDLRKLVKKMEG